MEHPAEALGYATMGERFLAFLCDGSVETLLIGLYLALVYPRSSLEFEQLKALAVLVIPVAYMTLAECLFRSTIGKWLLRIQVRADSTEPRYPSFFRILLRESVGKFVSGFILGFGFLAGTWHPKNKTWADRMAGTVVVSTGVASARRKALLVPILICANIGLSIALTEFPGAFRKNFTHQVESTEARIEDLHQKIFLSFFSPEPATITEYQEKVRTMPSVLDEYERLLAEVQELVGKTLKLAGLTSIENNRLEAYERVNRLRREIAVLVRKHVQNVLAFDPRKHRWTDLLRDRREMKQEINKRNNLMKMIGGAFLRKTISFESSY